VLGEQHAGFILTLPWQRQTGHLCLAEALGRNSSTITRGLVRWFDSFFRRAYQKVQCDSLTNFLCLSWTRSASVNNGFH